MKHSTKIVKLKGGNKIPLSKGVYYMRGKSHSNGGIDVDFSNGNKIEVENGEILDTNNDIVLSAKPMINGISPAQYAMMTGSVRDAYTAQENIKRKQFDNGGKINNNVEVFKKAQMNYSRPIEKGLEVVYPEFHLLSGIGGIANMAGRSIGGLATQGITKGINAIKGIPFSSTLGILEKAFNGYIAYDEGKAMVDEVKKGQYGDALVRLGALAGSIYGNRTASALQKGVGRLIGKASSSSKVVRGATNVAKRVTVPISNLGNKINKGINNSHWFLRYPIKTVTFTGNALKDDLATESLRQSALDSPIIKRMNRIIINNSYK